ncbi:MAG: outer membrane protein transport protein [Halioglobus sp.]|nr:outer membrane protein transport protein [Halioglobus sp.]
MKKILLGTTITLALLGAYHAVAGGLWLNEFGDFSGGRASAGAAAGTDEAATIIHNPASATRIQGSQLFGSVGALIPRTKFDVRDSAPFIGDKDGGQAGQLTPAVSTAYVFDNDWDKWSTGISVAGLAGASLDYDDDWVGRYQVTEVNLLVMALGATLAYQVTDKLSIGVKPQVYYATLTQKLNVPTSLITGRDDIRVKVDGDDTGFGGMVGAVYDFTAGTRVGISWQSSFDIEFDGNLKVNGNLGDGVQVNTDTQLTMAQYVRVALHHDVDDRLGLDFTLGWDNWDELDNIFVSVKDGGGAPIITDWKDTYHYAAGFQYKLNDAWDITAGIAYDTNVVNAKARVPELPIDEQIRFNAGTRYHFGNTLTVGGYANYTDLGSAKIDAEFWSGKYGTNDMFQVALFANWIF